MTPAFTELTLHVSRQDDRVLVVVAGDLDHDTAPDLRLQLEQAADDAVNHIDLDLGGVTFIDSAALQVFVAVAATLHDRGGLHITEASPLVARILNVTRLDDLLSARPPTPSDP